MHLMYAIFMNLCKLKSFMYLFYLMDLMNLMVINYNENYLFISFSELMMMN